MNDKKCKVWIYDVETLSNCFTYSAINRDTDEVVSYVVWKDRNDLPALYEHLKECKGQIGFNKLNFDYPVIHFILTRKDRLLKGDGDKAARAIYNQAQKLIGEKWNQIRYPDIPQLDLFKIHHFDNVARMTSLKKLEIALGFENVQDMPIHHTQEVLTSNEVDEILDYNINDIKATKVFYEKTIDKIELRKGLKIKYDLDCLNYSDSKIGEELMLKLYCEATNKDPYHVKKIGGIGRGKFKFNECIPSYVKFKTREFNELLEYLKEIETEELKQSFDFQFKYRDIELNIWDVGIFYLWYIFLLIIK